MSVLKELKDEKGKNFEELNMLHSLEIVPDSGTVNVKLNLTTDYRKLKTLVQ